MKKRKRRPGRPATGHDPVMPVRLPAKLIRDIDAWADVYRKTHELEGMTRSAAIRCLILLGLNRLSYLAIDPKGEITYEGPTAPLLKFYRSRKVAGWFEKGTAKKAKRRPTAAQHMRRQPMTADQVRAAADRAAARSKAHKPS